MNKQDLISVLAEKNGVSLREASMLFDSVFEVIEEAIVNGETVKVPNFGVFSVKERAGRQGVMPGTTDVINIPSKTVVTFRPSKNLKGKLN
jgi:DNA-binding protein HU-beta